MENKEQGIIRLMLENFGIAVDNMEKPAHCALSEVYFVNGEFILRARTLFPDSEEKLLKEIDIVTKLKGILNFEFPELMKTLDGNIGLLKIIFYGQFTP
jgi:hypothetical protein